MATKLSHQVAEFNKGFGIDEPDHPVEPSSATLKLCLGFLAEELGEMLEAAGASKVKVDNALHYLSIAIRSTSSNRVKLDELVDGTIDLDYYCEGFRRRMGVDGEPIADEVHRKNMEKLGGPRRADGKVLKPEGWTPPDVYNCLIDQGWTPPRGESDE